MKKRKILKIIFIMMIVFIPNICSAKTIKIDDIEYNLVIGQSIEEETFSYDVYSDTLTLKNANLKTVFTEENLNIVLVGDNYFKSLNANSIIAKNITISGEGTLNIETDFNGITGEKITINNTKMNIKAKNFCLKTSSSDNKDLIVNNSNLTLASDYNVFNVYNGNLYLNNSNILVSDGYSLLDTNSNNIYINNTNLNAKVSTVISRAVRYVYVNGISEIKIENERNYLMSKNYILGVNLKILGSQDGITYQEITDTSRDKFIHIYYEDSNLLLKEEQVKNKEIELEDLKINLDNLNNELKELKEELNNKEKELLLKEIDLNLKEEKLKEFNVVLDNKAISLLKKDQNLEEEKNNLDKIKQEIEIEKNRLNELLNKINQENKGDDIIYDIKNNYNDTKESFNFIENPKTFDSITNYILALSISLVVILIIFIKRRRFLDECN